MWELLISLFHSEYRGRQTDKKFSKIDAELSDIKKLIEKSGSIPSSHSLRETKSRSVARSGNQELSSSVETQSTSSTGSTLENYFLDFIWAALAGGGFSIWILEAVAQEQTDQINMGVMVFTSLLPVLAFLFWLALKKERRGVKIFAFLTAFFVLLVFLFSARFL